MKGLLTFICALAMLTGCGARNDADTGKTEITLMRFFGSCEAKFGQVTDARQGVGECGIVTALVNEFNATNKDNIVVRTQIGEWGPYYDQLTARKLLPAQP